MSLTEFVGRPEVKAKLTPLRPRVPRKLSAPLRIQPRSNRSMLVGTAFDYLLRFELQRRAPHAIAIPWVAERAPEMIWQKARSTSVRRDLLADARPDQYMPPEEVAKRASASLENARRAVAAYLKVKSPTAAMHAELAACAIRLAKLDSVCRRVRLEPGFQEASSEDVRDLVDLLAIVPFDDLLHNSLLLLNPTFGQTSQVIGGADTDLIAGDLLVDFKTTKSSEIDVGNLDQILGYLLLARKERLVDPSFPAINRLGLYFCRHGYLWSLEASAWTSHPGFAEIEQWFFQHADEVFGAFKNASPRLLPLRAMPRSLGTQTMGASASPALDKAPNPRPNEELTMKATRTETVIGLWWDDTSYYPVWIVGRNKMKSNGAAETTRTVARWPTDDYGDAYERARATALELGRKDGLPVILIDSNGSQKRLYEPPHSDPET